MRGAHRLLAALAVTALCAATPSLAAEAAPARAALEGSSVVAAAGDPVPLVIILDTSGSMGDRASSGSGGGRVVKLDAAKAALVDPIRHRPPGTELGIWTYPGGGSCGSGEWLVDVGSGDDTTSVLQAIDGLRAGGDTPTGNAIQGVVDSLTARGISQANLVVVSDGLSTCDPDPCVVAKGLAGQGFEVSIQAVGFAIEEEGRAELECIAMATGGGYYDVDDGEGLRDVLDDLTSPELGLDVVADPAPIAGASTLVTATVRNESAYDAPDVRLGLTYLDAGEQSVFPAVVPARVRLGNLPAGASRTYTWRVVAGVDGVEADARFVVSAWTPLATPVQVTGEFRSRAESYGLDEAGSVLDLVAKSGHPLVILGDSFSSGEGADDYVPASSSAAEECHRSRDTTLAPVVDAGGGTVDILACSGAVVQALDVEQRDGAEGTWRAHGQLWQLAELGDAPGAIVLTFGGNNIGFAGIVENCVNPLVDQDCGTETQQGDVAKRLGDLSTLLPEAYRAAWRGLNSASYLEAREGAPAPVIVLPYPLVVHDPKDGSCSIPSSLGLLKLTAHEVAFAAQLTADLNATIARAVATVRAEGYEVYYAGTVMDSFQPDRSVCDGGDSDVNGYRAPGPAQFEAGQKAAPETLHPNDEGYADMTDAVIGWSRAVVRDRPAGELLGGAVDRTLIDVVDDAFSRDDAVADVDLETGTAVALAPGQTVRVTASGFAPSSSVAIVLGSVPVALGALDADGAGRVDGYVLIPTTAVVGAHHLSARGLDSSGEVREVVVAASVAPTMPAHVLLVLLLAGLSALGAVVVAFFARRAGPAASSGSARV